jgi:predicted anti-sigma-YlaC factor YlaD
MSEHITKWLEAYYDGELPNRRVRQVEAHLETCPECLAELESLDKLSVLLQKAPDPDNLTPAETFAAQVGLRLPRKPAQSGWQKALRTGWQWIPVGLLGAWVFVQTAFIVSGILMWMLRIVPGAAEFTGWLPTGTRGTSLLGETTNLTGAEWTEIGVFGLDILRGGGPLGWGVTLNLGLTLLLGLLFLSWLASWWIQKTNGHQKSSQP